MAQNDTATARSNKGGYLLLGVVSARLCLIGDARVELRVSSRLHDASGKMPASDRIFGYQWSVTRAACFGGPPGANDGSFTKTGRRRKNNPKLDPSTGIESLKHAYN